MSVRQNLVFFIEPSEDAFETPLKGGSMIFNRFCIDEKAAFELSGVNYIKKWSFKTANSSTREFQVKSEAKGKEFTFLLLFYFVKLSQFVIFCKFEKRPPEPFLG